MQSEGPATGRAGGCLARLFWMGAGNFLLVMSAIGIFQNHARFTLTLMDALFWATAICLLAVRYIDIRYLGGETTDNRPASISDWRRYIITVLGVSLLIWGVAHIAS